MSSSEGEGCWPLFALEAALFLRLGWLCVVCQVIYVGGARTGAESEGERELFVVTRTRLTAYA